MKRNGRPRLAEAVVSQFIDHIVRGRLDEGDPLPSEGQIAEEFAVSRTVAREATATLADKGLVSTRQGVGTVVLADHHWNLLDPQILDAVFTREDSLEFFDNVIQIRRDLESTMAAQAAERIATEDERQLLALLKESDVIRLTDPSNYGQIDIELHDLIMCIAQNKLGRAIISRVQGAAARSYLYHGEVSAQHLEETHQAHTEIVNAILARDADEARAAMQRHITHSWEMRRRLPRA